MISILQTLKAFEFSFEHLAHRENLKVYSLLSGSSVPPGSLPIGLSIIVSQAVLALPSIWRLPWRFTMSLTPHEFITIMYNKRELLYITVTKIGGQNELYDR